MPRPVPVEVDRCPGAVAKPLPELPKLDLEGCVRAYGERGADGACFDPSESWRLAALLHALLALHADVAACGAEPTTPTTAGVNP